MRLIDANALKANLPEPANINQYWVYKTLCDFIDNAPTVGTDIEAVAKDAYEQGYTDGWKERFGEPNEKPQGEWQYSTHHARRYRICPFCKCEKEDDRSADWFYCCRCGAEMRGDKND